MGGEHYDDHSLDGQQRERGDRRKRRRAPWKLRGFHPFLGARCRVSPKRTPRSFVEWTRARAHGWRSGTRIPEGRRQGSEVPTVAMATWVSARLVATVCHGH